MPLLRCNGFCRRIIEEPGLLDGPCTYAIADVAARAVKIGKSDGHPQRRLDQLQTGNAHKLALLAYSVSQSEREVQRKLRKHRVRGEWFTVAVEVLQEVRQWDWLAEDLFAELWRAARLAEDCAMS
jgi:hypothetical protein